MEKIQFKSDYGVGQITSNDMRVKINKAFVNNTKIEGYKGAAIHMTSNNQLKIQIAFNPNNNVIKSGTASKLLRNLASFDITPELREILESNFIPKGSTPQIEQRNYGNYVITLDTVTTFNNIFVNLEDKYVYKILNFLNAGNVIIFQIAQYDKTYFNNNMGNFNNKNTRDRDEEDEITPSNAAAALLPGYEKDSDKKKKHNNYNKNNYNNNYNNNRNNKNNYNNNYNNNRNNNDRY